METDQQLNTPPATNPLVGKVVLWIEDDVLLTDIIKKKMQKLNTTLLHAFDSVGAFKILEENNAPDIIFLDILLPGLNGYEILEKIKKDEKTKNIPVIILSNFGQKSEIEKGLSLGADKFLIKATLTLDEVFSEANNLLNSKASK